jgi:dolichol-phosphate mannosyltransferase
MTIEEPLLSLVIPILNEQDSMRTLLDRVGSLLDQLRAPAEVVFVDDHSNDGSPSMLREAVCLDPRFRYLRLSRNSGSHVAILAGIELARGRCVVFLAADLQDPPELIPQMLDLWRKGNHVVWAVRERREGISLSEKIFARAFYWLMNHFSEVSLPPQGADFALLDRRVIVALLASAGADPSIGADIASLGFRQAQLPYVKAARRFGRSKWNLRRRLRAVADAFVGHSFAPVRSMSYAGMLMATVGFFYAAVIVALRLTVGKAVEGWASLMVVTLVLGGTQMTMLGVLGEYLIRTLREARGRPRYFVEEYVTPEFELPAHTSDQAQGFPAQHRLSPTQTDEAGYHHS